MFLKIKNCFEKLYKNWMDVWEIPIRENYVPVQRYSKYQYTGTKTTGHSRPRRYSIPAVREVPKKEQGFTGGLFSKAEGFRLVKVAFAGDVCPHPHVFVYDPHLHLISSNFFARSCRSKAAYSILSRK